MNFKSLTRKEKNLRANRRAFQPTGDRNFFPFEFDNSTKQSNQYHPVQDTHRAYSMTFIPSILYLQDNDASTSVESRLSSGRRHNAS